MKKLTFEELPDAVEKLYEKMKEIERFFEYNKTNLKKNMLQKVINLMRQVIFV